MRATVFILLFCCSLVNLCFCQNKDTATISVVNIKEEYAKSDELNITVINTSDATLLYYIALEWYVVDEGWRPFAVDISNPYTPHVALLPIAPHSKENLSYKVQSITRNRSESGQYRLAVYYKFQNTPRQEHVVYSAPFRVR